MKVELVLAPNPSLLTGPGTNTWVVLDDDESIVVDPGPVIDSHLDAIKAAIGGSRTRGVLVTHGHPDHAPAANGLAAELDVPALGAGPAPDFSPDLVVADGDTVTLGHLEVVCIGTPGHTADSISFRIGDALFAGDHIMGGSTVVVEDMAAYLTSLEKLRDTGIEVIHPGHGPIVDDPDRVIEEYVSHRLLREEQILEALQAGAESLGGIVLEVYADVDPALHPAAAMSVAAHLGKLEGEGRVTVGDEPTWDSRVALA